jgi:hypothetical protein
VTKFLLAVAVAAVALTPAPARAQQYAAQTQCQIAMDGGTSSVTNTCGPVLLNYQPFTANCQYNSLLDSTQGTITVQTSGDGVHFGVPTALVVVALPDGGSSTSPAASTSAFGPFGSSATATAHAAVDIFDFTANPTDPYLYAQVSATAKADGGASGDGITCFFSVIQSQTIHSPNGVVKGAVGVKTVH